MRQGYSVTVSKNGEPILTIEREMLSGAELSAEDEEAIRDAAEHLLAFVGSPDADAAFDEFNRVLDNPPKANEALRDLMRKQEADQ